MPAQSLTLNVLPETFAVCRLDKEDAIPSWAYKGAFTSITRTPQELSLLCPQKNVPTGVVCEKGWKALQVAGVLDFSLTGILYSILQPLTGAKISIFAVSTYDTDYILVKEERLEAAVRALAEAGFTIS